MALYNNPYQYSFGVPGQMNVSISTAKRLSRRVNNKIIKVC
jgi:hypothetical protein